MLSLPTSPETVSSPGWPRRLTTLGHGRDAASTDRDDGDSHEDQRQVGDPVAARRCPECTTEITPATERPQPVS
jgi:hypothetical protein